MRDIAKRFNMSWHTVNGDRHKVYCKLGIHHKDDLIKWAEKEGF